jgi:DNA-binding beta-propeller fold protein YncE
VLLVTLHADSAVAVIDLASGTERGRINVAQKSPHGVAITSDGRYAFVTTEGGGAARGTVDVIDLSSARRVSSVEVGYSPGSIDILPHQ